MQSKKYCQLQQQRILVVTLYDESVTNDYIKRLSCVLGGQ